MFLPYIRCLRIDYSRGDFLRDGRAGRDEGGGVFVCVFVGVQLM